MTPAASRPAATDQAIISCIKTVATGPGKVAFINPPLLMPRTLLEQSERKRGRGTLEDGTPTVPPLDPQPPPQQLSVEQLEPSPTPSQTQPTPRPARVTQPPLPSSANFCRDRARSHAGLASGVAPRPAVPHVPEPVSSSLSTCLHPSPFPLPQILDPNTSSRSSACRPRRFHNAHSFSRPQ